jgi:ligand-binding sensor domain-containing protein
MSDNAKMISLTAMCETATEVGTAQLQVQNAADILRAQGITHSVGFMEVEEGPEPSVWRDSDGVVWVKTPTDQLPYAENEVVAIAFAFTSSGPQMLANQVIENEWEVLY